MAVNWTQILLFREKLADEIVRNLQLASLEPSGVPKVTVEAAQDPPQAPADPLMIPISNSLELIDKLLSVNQMALELEKLRVKARAEVEDTWQLQDGLLLRHGKLYVPDGPLMPEMLLRTALIREAHDQPLMSHPGRTKLRQLLQSQYYWPGQGKDIDRYRNNCHACRRSHVPRDRVPGLLYPLPAPGQLWEYVSIDFKKCPESR